MCIICEDERQYVGHAGQKWIDREKLQKSRKNVLRDEEPNMLGIGTEPSFAIGQRALLIQTGGCADVLQSSAVHSANPQSVLSSPPCIYMYALRY